MHLVVFGFEVAPSSSTYPTSPLVVATHYQSCMTSAIATIVHITKNVAISKIRGPLPPREGNDPGTPLSEVYVAPRVMAVLLA
jgi:hypothetical protein